MYSDMAEKIYGGELRCEKCGIKIKPNKHDIAVFLQSGWPYHCGETMRYVSAKELDEEKKNK
jgi:hypothetical protein